MIQASHSGPSLPGQMAPPSAVLSPKNTLEHINATAIDSRKQALRATRPHFGNLSEHVSTTNQNRSFSGYRNIHGIWDPCISWLYPYMQKTQQKRKGGQIRFTNEQTDALEHKFDSHKYLSPQERKKLAKSLSLSERQVRASSLWKTVL
ncbi:homeobox domain protein [Oesophagostomum dentatum]|uniref:Homeobox domain protein n=1 Tax=Oesophagostomum dentatum TaxID=61180 RepID=A0A0B1TQH1_OESDE|nr:homeobox domain protein [Oesophagostomum dentatum]